MTAHEKAPGCDPGCFLFGKEAWGPGCRPGVVDNKKTRATDKMWI